MKKFVLALTAAAAFTAPALAADLAPRYAKAAPVAVAATPWTGCWISGGGGYQFDRVNHETWGGTVSTLRTQNISSSVDGWILTGGVGCDYQFNSRWVIGAFADGTWSNDVKGDYAVRLTSLSQDITIGQIKNPWSWAVGARVGYIVAPNVLTYVNAGFTQTRFDSVSVFDRTSNGGLNTGIQVAGQTLGGVFLGSGIEYSLDWLPGLFLKTEGRAAWFGNKDAAVACVTAGSACNGLGSPSFTSLNIDKRDTISYLAKTELVYRFNWGGPVVAKY
jgi:outer membrane immunogenic protein